MTTPQEVVLEGIKMAVFPESRLERGWKCDLEGGGALSELDHAGTEQCRHGASANSMGTSKEAS